MKTKKAPVSKKTKVLNQIEKWATGSKARTRSDISALMVKHGYSVASPSSVAVFYDLYTFGRKIHISTKAAESAKLESAVA